MRVTIKRIADKEKEQVVIECVRVTSEIREIEAYAESKGTILCGMVQEKHMKQFSLTDVFYFEAIDEKVFAYTAEEVFEIRQRLYEVEQAYEKYHFVRCSKSVVLNLMLLDSISPALNGRFFAHMKNGEKLIISRQYAFNIKQIVMGGKGNER